MLRLTKNFPMFGAGMTLVAVVAMHAGAGMAGESGEETRIDGVPAGPQTTTVQSPIAVPGLRVYRNPQTGQLGPPPPGIQPPDLTAAEKRMLNRSDRGLQSRKLPGGGVAIDLQGRYRNMAVATVGTDGQAEVNCEVTPEQATAALQAGQQTGDGSAD